MEIKNKEQRDVFIPNMELLSDTQASIEAYCAVVDMPVIEVTLLFILNELRCIHSHIDQITAAKATEDNDGHKS